MPRKRQDIRAGLRAFSKRLLTGLLPPGRELVREWPAALGAAVSVALLHFCFPPYLLWPLGFVALVPLLWGVRRLSVRGAFWLSLLMGLAFYYFSFNWVLVVHRFFPGVLRAAPLIDAGHAWSFAVGGAGVAFFHRRFKPWAALGGSMLWWAGWDWFRSVGPFASPVALLGHTVNVCLPLAQFTSIGGIPLLGAVVLGANLILAEAMDLLLRRRWERGAALRLAAAAGGIAVAFAWGAWVMSATSARERDGLPLRVAIVQPNIDQQDKLDSYSGTDEEKKAPFQKKIAAATLDLVGQIEPGSVDLVITPETSFTQDFFDVDLECLTGIRKAVQRLGAPLITGATDAIFINGSDKSRVEDPRRAEQINGYFQYRMYNGLFVFRPDEEARDEKGRPLPKLRAEYRKIHLLPFAETVPYLEEYPDLRRKIAPVSMTLEGETNQGPIPVKTAVTETGSTYLFGPSICYESEFAYLQNRMARRGAHLLINISNNDWFEGSLGIDFLFHGARSRAAETRLPFVLCSNSGMTAVLDGTGRVVEQAPMQKATILTTTIPLPRQPRLTLYARFGDWFGAGGFIASLAVVLMTIIRRKGKSLDVESGD